MPADTSAPLMVHLIDSLRVGGAQTHLLTMLRHAVAEGRTRHHVVSLFDDGPIGDELRSLGVPVDVLDVAPLLGRRYYREATRRVESTLRAIGPDIAEAHLTYSRILGLFAARRAGVARRYAFEHGDLYLTSWKFRLAHWLGQRLAGRVIVVSDALRAWAKSTYRLSTRRSVVLHNCVDTDRFDPTHVAPAELPIAPDTTRFVTVGTLGTGVNKRVDVLIRAIAEARALGADVALVVCGDGDQRQRLERLAVELEVVDAVHFLGMRRDVPEVLAACDVFVLGTAFDPFPIAGLEALSMGLPIVVPNRGGMVEAVEPGVTGAIYPVLDHRALGEVMATLNAAPDQRCEMATAARASALARFSVPGYMNRLYRLYGIEPANLDEVGA